ncbi:MAG: hypothetical protein ACPGXK_15745, partial [Phycisphaerae bacterium]
VFNFTVTGSKAGFTNGTANIAITRPAVTATVISGFSSGAAQPNDMVVLVLEEEDADKAEWAEAAGNPESVTLTVVDDLRASFTAPTVATTQDFQFDSLACDATAGTLVTATVTIPVQVGTVVIDFSSIGNEIELNETINLLDFITVENIDPADIEATFGAEEPDGVDFDLVNDVDNPTLTVTAGTGETVTVTVQIFGTSGLLDQDEVGDTLTIVDPE